MKPLLKLIAALVIALAAMPARAVPMLQLDIAGGIYDPTTQTIAATSRKFSLYAYGLSGAGGISLADSFYLAMAVDPVTSTPGDYGSFTYTTDSTNPTTNTTCSTCTVGSGTSTVNVTANMVYGTPPLETVLGGAGSDPGDLSQHGIYPTYFSELKFKFSANNQAGLNNTQDSPGLLPQSGSGMYYQRFDIDLTGLDVSKGVHFDLYNERLLTSGDIDVNNFAPFSHDAGFIPEPSALALLGFGLAGLGFARRRKRFSS